MAEQTSEAEAVKILADDARQAWMLRAERVQAIIRELSAANLAHDDPEFSAKLEVCERVVAAFIAAVQEWRGYHHEQRASAACQALPG